MTYDHGRFVWFEHVAQGNAGAHAFYAEVIGWKVHQADMPGGLKYPMLMAGEAPVGGFAEPPQAGIPPHWVSYVSVADVEESAKTVQKLGGRALGDAFDVPTVGRMMPVADPHGASFFLFRNANGDSDAVQGAGSFHWNELLSDDPEAAVAFYEGAFGYTHETMQMGGATYFVLKNGDALRGGVCKPNDLVGGRWLQYVTVDDCDAAVGRARKKGGKVATPSMDVPGVGRIAVIADPMGAQIGVIKPAAQ